MADSQARELSDAEVAQSVAGADKLIAVYGWSTPFHDAVVERVVIERLGPAVTMDLRTNEMCILEEPQRDVLARVTMRWDGVQDLRLLGADPNEENWIWGMDFFQVGDFIRADILQMDGIHGWILAERVEVLTVETIPWGTPLAQSDPA